MSKRHTILVVDDEPDVVKSVQDLLRLDYRVLGATRATEGLEMLRGEEVHVVMTDQRMPEMTGVQLLNKIRGEHPEAIRLLFTGYADIRAVIDAINQGNVYRYITKPWDPDELQTVIREAVERYDLIVERKRLTEELRQKNQEMETVNQQLVQANELKTAFIRVASHELRTPLTILIGATRLAMASGVPAGPLKEWLLRIERAEQRLQYLIDQLLTMLAVGQFDQKIQRTPTDLRQLLTDAADDIRPFVEIRRQHLQLELSSELQTMALDPYKIRNIVNHLLLNAVKFTPDGGTITLTARPANGGAEIVIRDTGAGIDPACLPRLFEPFFTGFDVSRHSSGTYEFGKQGIGLGLSVAKAFVELHGGVIDVNSELGKGTTFTIRLPAA